MTLDDHDGDGNVISQTQYFDAAWEVGFLSSGPYVLASNEASGAYEDPYGPSRTSGYHQVVSAALAPGADDLYVATIAADGITTLYRGALPVSYGALAGALGGAGGDWSGYYAQPSGGVVGLQAFPRVLSLDEIRLLALEGRPRRARRGPLAAPAPAPSGPALAWKGSGFGTVPWKGAVW